MTPLTIEEAFALAPRPQHDRHGEVVQHKGIVPKVATATDEHQHLSTSSESLLRELLAQEGFSQ